MGIGPGKPAGVARTGWCPGSSGGWASCAETMGPASRWPPTVPPTPCSGGSSAAAAGGACTQRLLATRDGRQARLATLRFAAVNDLPRSWPWMMVTLELVVVLLVAAFMSPASMAENWAASYFTPRPQSALHAPGRPPAGAAAGGPRRYPDGGAAHPASYRSARRPLRAVGWLEGAA